MVVGMESFREAFKEFPDCYTIIGGAACDIIMSDHDTDFRATKDIDMILILEDKYQEFAKAFWNYIKEAGCTTYNSVTIRKFFECFTKRFHMMLNK